MIYVVRQDEFFEGNRKSYVKVGQTARDVYARIQELQTGNPNLLHLYRQKEGGFREESELKHRLKPFRTPGGGEWFYLTPDSERILRAWFT